MYSVFVVRDAVDVVQVSVLLLRISDVGCAFDMKGDDLLVALEARDVVPEQLGNMTMQQLLSGRALGEPLHDCL